MVLVIPTLLLQVTPRLPSHSFSLPTLCCKGLRLNPELSLINSLQASSVRLALLSHFTDEPLRLKKLSHSCERVFQPK